MKMVYSLDYWSVMECHSPKQLPNYDSEFHTRYFSFRKKNIIFLLNEMLTAGVISSVFLELGHYPTFCSEKDGEELLAVVRQVDRWRELYSLSHIPVVRRSNQNEIPLNELPCGGCESCRCMRTEIGSNHRQMIWNYFHGNVKSVGLDVFFYIRNIDTHVTTST